MLRRVYTEPVEVLIVLVFAIPMCRDERVEGRFPAISLAAMSRKDESGGVLDDMNILGGVLLILDVPHHGASQTLGSFIRLNHLQYWRECASGGGRRQ
jgi:hypothetical protein